MAVLLMYMSYVFAIEHLTFICYATSYKKETISFEEMGPVIINTDGTTRQIANWDQMTKREQEVTWKRISKRNEERRKALLEQQKSKEKEKEGEKNA